MTTDRDFDGIAKAWLAGGPEELSDRVLRAVADDVHQTRQRHARRLPWRFPTMSLSARASALLVLGALVAVVGLAILGGAGRTSPTPTPAPTAHAVVLPIGSPSAAPSFTAAALTETFTSTRNGFSVGYPADWTVKPATGTWRTGSVLIWGNSGLDVLATDDIRLNVAAQPLAPGQTEASWIQANCILDTPANECAALPAAWEKVTIDGVTGYRDANGEVPPVQGVVPGGVIFAAIAVTGEHAYQIVMDGHVDRAMFDAFLETVRFAPDDAIDLPPVAETFESPTYGYRIGLPAGWTATPASASWASGGVVAPPQADAIKTPTGATFVNIASAAVPAGATFDDWLAEFHRFRSATASPGCIGDDPATWPVIQIGDQTGRLETTCDVVEALVEVGGRAYAFTWGNEPTDTGLNLADWKEFLATAVRFDPGMAATFTSPRYGYSIRYPSGWIAGPATKSWLAGTETPYGDPALDTIGTTDARLAIASQPLAGTFYFKRHVQEGQTADEWLVAHCGTTGLAAASCGSPILIGGQPGWLHQDGAPASGGTVTTGGVIFDAAVVYGDRGYEFTLDGKVDRALFEALLASVSFDADGAIDLPPLTKTFTSPTYGYSIGLAKDFVATPAKSRWDPRSNIGDSPQDVIGMPNLDLFVMAASTAIPTGTTFDDWLAANYPPSAGDAACIHGDRSTWPSIQVGNEVGDLRICGNSIRTFVGVGGRAYEFSWSTQVADVHHTLADWKEMLKSVTFEPSAATP